MLKDLAIVILLYAVVVIPFLLGWLFIQAFPVAWRWLEMVLDWAFGH